MPPARAAAGPPRGTCGSWRAAAGPPRRRPRAPPYDAGWPAAGPRRRRGTAWPARRSSQLLVRLRVPAEQPPVRPPERRDRRDLLVAQLEAEDVEVLALPLRRRGLRDRDRPELHLPAQDRLAGRDAQPLGGGGHRRLVERRLALAERAP